jgi:transposase
MGCSCVVPSRPSRSATLSRFGCVLSTAAQSGAVPTQFLAWCCLKLEALGARVWVVIWDNASWHVSKAVRAWIRTHNQQVKQPGQGVRVLSCYLPVKSPWLNPIEPQWVHGKRAIVQPDRLLSARELADRACAYFGCPHEDHLIQEHVS